jgi:hypothetical protein
VGQAGFGNLTREHVGRDEDAGAGLTARRSSLYFQSTRWWEICQTWVTDFAGLGHAFFVRCGSRILRYMVGGVGLGVRIADWNGVEGLSLVWRG